VTPCLGLRLLLTTYLRTLCRLLQHVCSSVTMHLVFVSLKYLLKRLHVNAETKWPQNRPLFDPHVTGLDDEWHGAQETNCERPSEEDLNDYKAVPVIPISVWKWQTKMSWSIVSKGTERSKRRSKEVTLRWSFLRAITISNPNNYCLSRFANVSHRSSTKNNNPSWKLHLGTY